MKIKKISKTNIKEDQEKFLIVYLNYWQTGLLSNVEAIIKKYKQDVYNKLPKL
jgi:hypothetical protein